MGKKYSRLKAFRYLEHIDTLTSFDKIMPPIHIRLKPTNKCNHKCWYCSYRLPGVQLGKDIDFSDSIPWGKMKELIYDLGLMKVKAVTLSGGGEPLLYEHIKDLIASLASWGIKIAVLTNGSLLNGQVAQLLAKYASWVRVSIDGWDPGSYAEYRGVDFGEFGRVMNNLDDFSRLGGYLSACIIVDKKNHLHLAELIKELASHQVQSIKVASAVISNNSHENLQYHLPLKKDVDIQLAEARARYPKIEFYNSFHTQIEHFEKGYCWCPFLMLSPVIGADCNVYYCHDKAYNLTDGCMGTIKNKSFKDFWMKNTAKFFAVDPRYHCNHHCMADEANKQIIEFTEIDKEHKEFV